MLNTSYSFKYNGKEYFCSKDTSSFDVCRPEEGVSVTAKLTEYKNYDAMEWVLYFENTSDANSGIFSDIWDSNILLPLCMPEPTKNGFMPASGSACIITMNGMVQPVYYHESDKVTATEYSLNYEYLDKAPDKTKSFEETTGRSSEGLLPFFDVTADGNGYICAIGWTGSWKSEFTAKDNGINIKTALTDAEFYLKSGERIRTSSILIMKYTSNEDKYNKFRRLMKNCICHKAVYPHKREGICAFEFWGSLPSDIMLKRLAELKEYGITFEDVWIDAGWHGEGKCGPSPYDGEWEVKVGNWKVNSDIHPQRLCDVKDAANSAGMKLMLWFEPERTMPSCPVVKEHPEWILDSKGYDSSLLLNFGIKEVEDYVFASVSGIVKDLELSVYRQDSNRPYRTAWLANDEENRKGITQIKHIMGMYSFWDRLLQTHPQIIIDNCAAGGRRFDIESLKRTIPFFRSDYQCAFNANPEVLQVHNSGISHYLPTSGCSSKIKGDTYAIRSSYSSSWGGAFYNGMLQSFDEDDFLWARKTVDEYKRIRHYFSCDFHNHGSLVFDDTSWTIWQYHDPDTHKGIVMAFRRSNSPFDRVNVDLKGIPQGKVCCIRSLDNPEFAAKTNTFEIILPQKRTSVIFEYEALGE